MQQSRHEGRQALLRFHASRQCKDRCHQASTCHNRSDFVEDALDNFHPGSSSYWEYLRAKRTDRWGTSNVHGCALFTHGMFWWYDWTNHLPYRRIDGFQRDTPIGLLLDLDEGTLTMYQNGQRIALLKDGLSGEYCWYATVWSVQSTSVSIERSFAPDD